MTKLILRVSCSFLILGLALLSGCTGLAGQDTVKTPGTSVQAETLTLRDGFSREVTIPFPPDKIVCSGAGCLRYAVYLGGQDLVAGVDDIEKKNQVIEGRPYTLAYGPQFKDLPLIGEFRGKDDPEKIILIQPDVIFKASTTGQPPATSAAEADKLQDKTGIPVIRIPIRVAPGRKKKRARCSKPSGLWARPLERMPGPEGDHSLYRCNDRPTASGRATARISRRLPTTRP